MRRKNGRFGGRGLAVAAMAAMGLGLASPVAAQDNAASRWMEQSLDSAAAAGLNTGFAGRSYAMASIAMYDAVNGINNVDGGDPAREHGLVPPEGAPANADATIAAAAAAHAVLVALHPEQTAELDAALEAERQLAGVNQARYERGLEWGASVGQQIVDLRAEDGTHEAFIVEPIDERGHFSNWAGQFRQAWDARFANSEPFGLDDISQYLDFPEPPALDSREYATALIRSYLLGAPDHKPENDALAAFWHFPSNSIRESGAWFAAALELARQEGTVASLSDTTRLFALMGMAISDSFTIVANAKREYFSWRPYTAIRNANRDGNPYTRMYMDPNWQPRFGQIGGSPEFLSGQSAFAGAGPTVLSEWFCRDDIAFSFSTGKDKAPRSYESFAAASDEAKFSRILQGNHLEFSNNTAQATGRQVAHQVTRNRLQRVGGRPEIVEFCPQF